MANESKKATAKKATRREKKGKRAPATKAGRKRTVSAGGTNELDNTPFVLGYEFYRFW